MSRTETIRPATLVSAGAWEAVGADAVTAMSDGVPSGPGRFDPSAVNYVSGSRATGPIVFDLADLAANLAAGEWIESVTIRTLYARTVSADPFTLTHRASWDAGAGRVNVASAQPSFPQSWALGAKLNQPIVSIAARPQGDGFWLVAGDGGVFAVGAARFLGSGVGVVDTTVRDIAAHPSGDGYYLLADSGSVYAYGCQHYGSQSGGGYIAIVPTNTGKGYWLITTTGFIQPYGDAVAYTSVPITAGHVAVGAAGDPRANGLWIADSDGAVFVRGNAAHHGDASAETLAAPITGIAGHSSGLGYWLVGEDGGIFAYGAAPYRGNVVDVISSHAGTKAVDLFGFSAQGYWVADDKGKVIAVDPDAREARLTLTRGSGDHGSVAESDAESLRVSYEVSKAGGSLAGAPLILLDIAADVLVNTKPTATITAPVGTVTTTSAPVVRVTYGDVDGDPHSHTRAMFLDGAELDAAATAAGKTVAGVLAGLEPDDTMPATVLADSGELVGGKVEWTPPALDNGVDMYVVAWVGHASPRWPDGKVVWSEPDVEGVSLDLQAPAPAAGTVDIDSTLQRYTLELQGHDNLATAAQSEGTGGWDVRENSQPLTYAPAGVLMEAATDGAVAMSFDTPATEGPMTIMVTVETAQPANASTLRPVELLVELLDDAGLLVGTLNVGPETLQRKRADEPEPPAEGSIVYHELVYYASETRTTPTPVPSDGSLTLGDNETEAWFSIRPKADVTVPAGWVLERFASWDPGVDNFRVPTWVDVALVPAGYVRGEPTGEWYAASVDAETIPPDAGTIADPGGWPDYWGGDATRAFALPVPRLPVGTYAEGNTRPPLYAEATFRAADGKLYTERYRAPFTVAASTATNAPKLVLTPDFTSQAGRNVALSAAPSTDPDGGTLTFTWTLAEQPSGSALTLTGTGDRRTLSAAPTVVGDYVVNVDAVSSTSGLKSTGSVRVTVKETAPLVAPIARLTGPASAAVGELVTLDARLSEDPQGGTVTYDFFPTSQPTGSAVSSNSGGAEWSENTPTNGVTTFKPTHAGDHHFKVNVASSTGELSSATLILVVTSTATPDPGGGIAGDQPADTPFLEPSKAGYLWRLSGSAVPWDKRLGPYSINYAEGSPPNNYQQETRSTPQGTRPVMISYHEGNLSSRYGVDIRCRFENMGLGRYTELYMRYYRRVRSGFRFSQGKEPGLQGKVLGGSEWWPATTGFSGQHDYRQFSARTMFKGTGMITYANAAQWNGRWHEDNRTSSGTMYSFSYRYEKPWGSGDQTFVVVDTWHAFEQRVKLNDVGSDNGVFEGWVDDVLSYRSTRVRWRGTSSTQGVSTADAEEIKIDQLNGVQFYGGPKEDYPTRPTKIEYDDFVISTQPIGLR